MDPKSNGNGKTDMIGDTGAPGSPTGAPGRVPGKMRQFLSAGILGGTINPKTGSNAIDQLYQPGDDLQHMLMRTDFPNPDIRLAILFEYENCIEFEDAEGARQILNYAAALVADRGRRTEIVKQAIIGDRDEKARQGGFGGSVGKWLRDNAFGGDGKE